MQPGRMPTGTEYAWCASSMSDKETDRVRDRGPGAAGDEPELQPIISIHHP
jgi:hypothetical protein